MTCINNHHTPNLASKITDILTKKKINNDIEEGDIEKSVQLRNRIIHRSYVIDSDKQHDEITEALFLLREILVRIVFSKLNFEGSYFCYIGGEHIRTFPSCQRQQSP